MADESRSGFALGIVCLNVLASGLFVPSGQSSRVLPNGLTVRDQLGAGRRERLQRFVDMSHDEFCDEHVNPLGTARGRLKVDSDSIEFASELSDMARSRL